MLYFHCSVKTFISFEKYDSLTCSFNIPDSYALTLCSLFETCDPCCWSKGQRGRKAAAAKCCFMKEVLFCSCSVDVGQRPPRRKANRP